ncbi:7529_t:CDS:2 [Funneliformis geosporum]|nr:7529_t:CDS:2 [Funneliformis geosporum]
MNVIFIFLKGEEVECKINYKHDGETGNIKQHLQIKRVISSADDLQLNFNEKIQTHINKMIRKVIPHHVPKQAELKQVTAKWLVTDSLPFNVIHRKGYKKIIQKFDPIFILLNNKSIKKDLAIAYQKGILAFKKTGLISIPNVIYIYDELMEAKKYIFDHNSAHSDDINIAKKEFVIVENILHHLHVTAIGLD